MSYWKNRASRMQVTCALLLSLCAGAVVQAADSLAPESTATSAATSGAPTDESAPTYALLGPAFTYHQQHTHSGRRYNQQNWGAGIEQEKTLQNPLWERTLDLSVLEDSFRHASLFATGAFTRGLMEVGALQVRGGLEGGVVYKYMEWQGHREVVPVLGPNLVLRERPHGFGFTTTYMYHRNETTGRVNGLFTCQTLYKF